MALVWARLRVLEWNRIRSDHSKTIKKEHRESYYSLLRQDIVFAKKKRRNSMRDFRDFCR